MPPVVTTPPPSPVAAPAAPPPAPAVVTPVQRADPEAIAKARDALRQKIEETPAVTAAAPVVAAPPVVTAAPAPVAKPVPQPAPVATPVPPPAPAVVVSDTPVPPPAPSVQRADPEAIAKARDAVRQRIEESPATPPAPIVPPPVAAAPAPTFNPGVVATPAPSPAPAPAPPLVVAVTAPPALPPSDLDAISKARDAVRQKINFLDFEPGPKADPEGASLRPLRSRPPAGPICYLHRAHTYGSRSSASFT